MLRNQSVLVTLLFLGTLLAPISFAEPVLIPGTETLVEENSISPIAHEGTFPIGRAFGFTDETLVLDFSDITWAAFASEVLKQGGSWDGFPFQLPTDPTKGLGAEDILALDFVPADKSVADAIRGAEQWLLPGDMDILATYLTAFDEATKLNAKIETRLEGAIDDSLLRDLAAGDATAVQQTVLRLQSFQDRLEDSITTLFVLEEAVLNIMDRNAIQPLPAGFPLASQLAQPNGQALLQQHFLDAAPSTLAELFDVLGTNSANTAAPVDLSDALDNHFQLLGTVLDEASIEDVNAYEALLGEEASMALGGIIATFTEMESLLLPYRDSQSVQDIDLVAAIQEAVMFPQNHVDPVEDPSGFATEAVQSLNLKELVEIDRVELPIADEVLASIAAIAEQILDFEVDEPQLQLLEGQETLIIRNPQPTLDRYHPILFYLGTPGDEVQPEGILLGFDLGGNDRYGGTLGGAGYGTTNTDASSLFIDFGGNDQYTTSGSYEYTLGSGYYGRAGIFVDVAGDDTYTTSNYGGSLGSGATGGIGVFADMGGNDVYTNTRSSSSLGASTAGVGIFADYNGDDSYSVSGTSLGRYLGTGVQGVGIAIEGGGNDRYDISSKYCCTSTDGAFGAVSYLARGAASLGLGVFIERAGNDDYVLSGLPGMGHGAGPGGLGLFEDLGGDDSYEINAKGTHVGDEYGNGATWSNTAFTVVNPEPIPGPLLGGMGSDREVPDPLSGAQLVTTVGQPNAHDIVRPASQLPFKVTVANRGTEDATGVTGALLVASSGGGASVPQTFEIPLIPAGEFRTETLYWDAPSATGPFQYEVTVAPAGPGDVDGDNRFAGTFTVDSVKDVRAETLALAKTALVPPSSTVPINMSFVNLGNEDQSFDIEVTYCKLSGSSCSGTPVLVDTEPTTLAAPSNVARSPALRNEATYLSTFSAPSTDGDYRVIIDLVGAEAQAPGQTTIARDFEVVTKLDFATEILNARDALDVTYFDGMDLVAYNAGTVYGEGDITYVVRNHGAIVESGVVAENVGLGFNEQQAIHWNPTIQPKNGDVMTFTFKYVVPGDVDASNDASSHTIEFIEGAVDQLKFDTPDGVTATGEWEHGVPTYGSLSPLHSAAPDRNLWATDLNSYVTGYTFNQLILEDLDFQNFLDPAISFELSMHTYSLYGALRVYARDAVTEGAWKEMPPVDGYRCATTSSQKGGSAECGSFGWDRVTVELTGMTGKVVDVMFELDQGYSPSGYAGAAIDDVLLLGSERLDHDVQVMDVRTLPSRLTAGTPAETVLVLRNNGFQPVSGTVDSFFSIGTTSNGVPSSASFSDIPGGEVFEVALPWTPLAAKNHFMAALVDVPSDPVLSNNILDVPMPVYIPVASLDPETANAANWAVSGSPDVGEWELGIPEGGAAEPLDGTLVWATDLDGAYTRGGEHTSYTQQYHGLHAPSIDVTNHQAGDKYLFAFDHEYEIGVGSSIYYDDIAFVTMAKNGASQKLIEPRDGYDGNCYSTYYCSTSAVGNPAMSGFKGSNKQMEAALFDLQDISAGDSLEFGFYLWSNTYQYQYGSGPRDGWTLDGIELLKAPRFDYDLEISGLSPAVLNLGDTETISATIVNNGAKSSTPQSVDVKVTLPTGDVLSAGSVAVPVLAPGQSYIAEIEASIPATYTGEVELFAVLDWAADEWNLNNKNTAVADVGVVLHRADFEQDNGGWTPSTGMQRGIPNIPAPQGQKAFFTGPLTFGKSGELAGPTVSLKTSNGVRLPELEFRADIHWINRCPYNGFRLVDEEINGVLPFDGLSVSSVYSFGTAHCGPAESETLSRSLVNRQSTDTDFSPVLQYATYPWSGATDTNNGFVVDAISILGTPYSENMAITSFQEPAKPELGPGEEALISVLIQDQGLNRPDGNIAVRFTSGDIGPNGQPSLNKVVPVPQLGYGESTLLETTWTPSTILDGRNVRLTAELVTVGVGGVISPLIESDGSGADNLLDYTVSIVGRHDLALDVQASPSLDPDQARPIDIETTLNNFGTLTEQDINIVIQVLDEAGAELARFEVLDRTKRPNNVEVPTVFRHSWTPPGIGHYQILATLEYPDQLDDLRIADNQKLAFAHLGVLPYGISDALDTDLGQGLESQWTAGGGTLLLNGWGIKQIPGAPEGANVLHTNPGLAKYGHNWDQEAKMLLDLRAVNGGTVSFKETYGILDGDAGVVEISADGGQTWTQLGATRMGSVGWTETSYDITPYAGDIVALRFVFTSNQALSSTGWAIDEVMLNDGTPQLVQGFESPLGSRIEHWDFETSGGWTVDSGSMNWEIGEPAVDGIDAQSGINILATNLDGGYGSTTVPAETSQYAYSPSFQVPETGMSTLAWKQLHQIQTSAYTYYPSDAAAVEVGVGGVYEKVEPTVGYTHGELPVGTGWTGARPWTSYQVDLSEYAGETVTIRFGLHMPSTYRYYHGPASAYGLAIDDVSLYATIPATKPVADDVELSGLELPDAFLVGTSEDVGFVVQHNGANTESVRVDWSWIGPNDDILDNGFSTADVGPEGHTFTTTLAAPSESVGTRLEATVRFVDHRLDAVPANNLAVEGFSIFIPLLQEGFEATACGASQPCLGWTHEADYGTNEWQHGSVPITQFGGIGAHGGSSAFVTDLVGDGNYPTYSRMDLHSPPFTVPAEGAVLSYWQALDTAQYYSNYDGLTVFVNGQTAYPEDGYMVSNCAYYASYEPCDWGSTGWTERTIDLAPWAGQTVKVTFRLSSDYYDNPNGNGVAIDDVLVIRPAESPDQDGSVESSEVVRLDPRLSDSVSVIIRNNGQEDLDATKVAFEWVGAVQTSATLDVPAISAGEFRAVEIPVPEGQTSGARLITRLTMADGTGDENPANDVRVSEIEIVQASGQFDPVRQLALVQSNEKGLFTYQKENGVTSLHVDSFDRMNSVQLLSTTPSPGSVLLVDHAYDMIGGTIGFDVLANGEWLPLQPLGGYDKYGSACGTRWFGTSTGPQCFAGQHGRETIVFPLDSYAGTPVSIRARYEGTSISSTSDWNIYQATIASPFSVESLQGPTRWALGGITNELGPLEEASQPGAWGIGLEEPSKRLNAFEVLESPVFLGKQFPSSAVEFDLWMSAADGDKLLVQQRDAVGGWMTLETFTANGKWVRERVPLLDMDSATQVRFVHQTGSEEASLMNGLFLDNLYIGSLSGTVTPIWEQELPPVLQDGIDFTLPVRIENTGIYTNEYTLNMRGPDPYWRSTPAVPSVRLQPGESVVTDLLIEAPFGGETGHYNLQILATSLFDTVQTVGGDFLVNLTVSQKPDLQLNRIGFQSSFTTDGDPRVKVEDARANTLTATVENIGKVTPTEDVIVQFVEVYTGGEIRPIDSVTVPASNLTHIQDPLHAPYEAFVSWFPRKGVEEVRAIVNPEVIGNPAPLIPEMSEHNNEHAVLVEVIPRALPELELVGEPAFSRGLLVDAPVNIGVDIRNKGAAPGTQPVDVAVLAGYQDAHLTSPVRNLPGNTLLRMVYDADLEIGADAAVLEILQRDVANPEWVTLTPIGGYPNGCILALECRSGISGTADGRTMTFDLREFHGEVQFRLRFAMDSHNGRVYDGLAVQSIVIEQFFEPVMSFRFTDSSAGWTADHTWRFTPREGPIPGEWAIPRNYANPYVVNLKTLAPLPNGALDHVDLGWTPSTGGEQELLIFIDPKNLEPEFVDDENRFTKMVKVRVSGVDFDVNDCVCLEGPNDAITVPIVLTNTGNERSTFDLTGRDHKYFGTTFSLNGIDLENVALGAGKSVSLLMTVAADAAPAQAHTVFVDLREEETGKLTSFVVPVEVEAASTKPDLVGGDAITLARETTKQFTVSNPSNGAIDVLLRVANKPNSLAVAIQPSEFSLAPFEARTISLQLTNLGVAPSDYVLDIQNARQDCTEADCNVLGSLNLKVLPYTVPTVKFDVPVGTISPGEEVQFTDNSETSGSNIAKWEWDFGDGKSSSAQSPTHRYDRPGSYPVKLTVTDSEGQRVPGASKLVIVTNEPPTASVDWENPGRLEPGVLVNFTAEDSIDAEGQALKVVWAFGDGTQASGVSVQHAYARPGTYKVTVAVEDVFGDVDLEEFTIKVETPESLQTDDVDVDGDSEEAPGPALWMLLGALAIALRRRKD